MKSMKKAVVLLLCVGAIAAASVFGTMAYLTDNASATNTFTVGNVTITLDEKNVDGLDKDGNNNEDVERDTANTYKLVPGATYTKDPIIHVTAGSEDCYLFVKVENGLEDIEAETNTIASQMATNGWELVANQTNIYYYEKIVSAENAAVNVPVFGSFTIDGATVVGGEGSNEDGSKYYLGNYDDKSIDVIAYAIQAQGFTDANAAWTGAGAQAQGN